MGLRIIYSGNAQKDLKSIYNYIRKDSVRYANNEVRLIRTAIQKLRPDSLLNKKFELLNDEQVREFVFRDYRIIYKITDSRILILSIHHHARSITNNPAFTDED